MAYIASTASDNTSINEFLGLNLSETGATNLKLGESPKMVNFKVSHDYKLEKMYGYRVKYDIGVSTTRIKAMWFGKLNNTEVFVYTTTNGIYNGTTKISDEHTGTDKGKIFEFNKCLYFLTGTRIL